MTQDRNTAIRERAHALWVESGHVGGRSEEHWLRAEREWDEAAGSAAAASPADSKATKAKAPTPSGRPKQGAAPKAAAANPDGPPAKAGGRARAQAGSGAQAR